MRVFGAGHSANDIAMSDERLLDLRGLDKIRAIDFDRNEVEVEAGVSLRALSDILERHGLALPNLGSISDQTVAGALATGTHGTGAAFGVLSTGISELEMLTVDGCLKRANATREPDLFAAGRLSLGALGVHTAFRLKVTPAFDLRVEEGPITLEVALDESWWSSADHCRIWYLPYVEQAWGWRAFRTEPAANREKSRASLSLRMRERVFGYHAYQAALWAASLRPSLLPAVNRAYAQAFLARGRGSSGRSQEKLTLDCLFRQRVCEWAVPAHCARDAALGVRALVESHGFRAHLPIEIRFTAGDDIWLSPAFGGARCWIGAIAYLPWGRDSDWTPWFDAFGKHMAAFEGRPHWAKYFKTSPASLRRLYPRWDDFRRLRRRLDPENRLRNAFTERTLEA